MKRILVLYEKHGPKYFDVTTEGQKHLIALKILKVRHDNGWYTDPHLNPPVEPTIPRDLIGQIKNDAERNMLSNLWQQYDSAGTKHINASRQWLDMKFAFVQKDGKTAWRILNERSSEGHEYEALYLVKLEERYR